jgi:hypothetical protein
MKMFSKTFVAAVIALVSVLAAPAASFAQQPTFRPGSPTVQRGLPAAEMTVTSPRGRIIGTDPDANVRYEMRRDHEHYK